MDGILVVDKPKGHTSHDIVDLIRKRFRIKKVGHAGTLDPQASGVLVVLLGRLTKKSQDLTQDDKEYLGCLRLGVATDSLDSQGKIVKEEKPGQITLQQIEDVFGQFLGTIEQIPPMFSALKYKGQRLYHLARKGIEVKRQPRQVRIRKLQITKFTPPDIHFTVKCSKGTYVRSLCSDIAARLGCVGHLSELRRVASGRFTIDQAVRLDQLQGCSTEQFEEKIIRE
ncbi:tRNA pseudouridine(55) synthase TruB [Candidatus Omnitrophota bacterium]